MAMWPASYSSAEGFLTSIVLVPSESDSGGAEGELVIVGVLPKDISPGTLRPFFDENFRSLDGRSSSDGNVGDEAGNPDPATENGASFQCTSLVLTDGAGSPFFVTAARINSMTSGATLAVCSAFPAFSLAQHVLGLLLQAATRAVATGAKSDRGCGANGSCAELAGLLHAAVFAIPPPLPDMRLSVGASLAGAAEAIGPISPLQGGEIGSVGDGRGSDGGASARGPLKDEPVEPEFVPGQLGVFEWPTGGSGATPLDASICDNVCLGAVPAAALISAWDALLFESPVVVVSSSSELLTPCVALLASFLRPLTLSHSTVPVLPPTMLDILEAPFPFLVGVRADTFWQRCGELDLSPSLCVLDLDAGLFMSSFTANGDSHPDAPAADTAASNAGQSSNRLPQPFLDALSRRIGAAANAQRVSSQKISSKPMSHQGNASSNSSRSGGLTGLVLAEVHQAMRELLGPRHLPEASTNDDDDDDHEKIDDDEKDKGWLPVNVVKRAEQSAKDKLERGVISEAEFREIIRMNKAMFAAAKSEVAEEADISEDEEQEEPLIPAPPTPASLLWGPLENASFRRTNAITEALACACGGLWLRCADQPSEESLGRALWCEQDSLSVCFWDKANAPPVLFLRLKSIGGVSAAPYLPDGCCFSVSVASETGPGQTILLEASSVPEADLWVRALESAARSRGGAKGWCGPEGSSSPPPFLSPNNSNSSVYGSLTPPGSATGANSRGSFRNQTTQSMSLAVGGSFDLETGSDVSSNTSSNGNNTNGFSGQSSWYTNVTSSAFDGPRNAIRSTQHFGIYRNESMTSSQFDLLWSLSDDVALSALAAHSASCRHESQPSNSGPAKLRKRPGELSGAAADAARVEGTLKKLHSRKSISSAMDQRASTGRSSFAPPATTPPNLVPFPSLEPSSSPPPVRSRSNSSTPSLHFEQQIAGLLGWQKPPSSSVGIAQGEGKSRPRGGGSHLSSTPPQGSCDSDTNQFSSLRLAVTSPFTSRSSSLSSNGTNVMSPPLSPVGSPSPAHADTGASPPSPSSSSLLQDQEGELSDLFCDDFSLGCTSAHEGSPEKRLLAYRSFQRLAGLAATSAHRQLPSSSSSRPKDGQSKFSRPPSAALTIDLKHMCPEIDPSSNLDGDSRNYGAIGHASSDAKKSERSSESGRNTMESVLASAMAIASQADPQPARENLLEFVANARKSAEKDYLGTFGDAKVIVTARIGVLRLCESNVWNALGDSVEALHSFPDGLYSSSILKSEKGSRHSSGDIFFRGIGDVWRARSVVLKALSQRLKAHADAVLGRVQVFDDEYDQTRGADSMLRESFCAATSTSNSQDDTLVDALVWLVRETHGRPQLFAEARLLAVSAVRLRLEEEMRSTRQISADKASLEKANKRGSMVDVPEPTSPAANVDSYGFFSEDKTAILNAGPSPESSTLVSPPVLVADLLARLIALVRFHQPALAPLRDSTVESLPSPSSKSGSAPRPPMPQRAASFSSHSSSSAGALGATWPAGRTHSIKGLHSSFSPSSPSSSSSRLQPVSTTSVAPLTKEVLRSVCEASGFSVFVQETRRLGDASVDRWLSRQDLSDNERLCFNLNLCNLMTLHGLVIRGPPSNPVSNALGRGLFQSRVLYALGTQGVVLDISQVEHSLLRANLSPPSFSFFGSALGSPTRPFPANDLRANLCVRHPPPELSFGLCACTISSPSLYVFRDPLRVESDLKSLASAYLKKDLTITLATRTAHMPEYMQWFAKDFGASKRDALRHLLNLSGRQNLPVDALKIKVEAYDWSPAFAYVLNIGVGAPLSPHAPSASVHEKFDGIL